MMNLNGLNCLITGSTGSLGGVIALALARAGCHCICHYHSREDIASQLVEQIAQMGQKAVALRADLRCPEQIESLFAQSRSFGEIRILINSAAIFSRRPLSEVTNQSIRDMMDVNLTAPLIACRHFVKHIGLDSPGKASHSPSAKIINLVDIGGIRPWAEYVEYCASKAALIAATKSLAKELAPTITVNAVAPGIIVPDLPVRERTEFSHTPENQKRLAAIPLGRFGISEEVVHAALFLLSNDYITGQVIQVDGGRVI